jgi:hypothetical protein
MNETEDKARYNGVEEDVRRKRYGEHQRPTMSNASQENNYTSHVVTGELRTSRVSSHQRTPCPADSTRERIPWL